MNITKETATAEERYWPGVELKVMTYTTASGRTFRMLRPVHCANTFCYVGRNVTHEEMMAIWNYHALFA